MTARATAAGGAVTETERLAEAVMVMVVEDLVTATSQHHLEFLDTAKGRSR